MDVDGGCDLVIGPGTVADRSEQADLDRSHESRGLAVGLGDILQPDSGDRCSLRLSLLALFRHGVLSIAC
jgi:hypothetical protein